MWKKILGFPRAILVLTAAATVFFALQLPKTRLDNDVASFIPRDHPSYLALKKMEGVFGEDLALSVGLAAKSGDFFTAGHLRTLIELTGRLEAVPDVDSVTSLSTMDYIEGTPDGFRVVPVLDPGGFGGGAGEIAELKNRLASWTVYERSLYSPDFRAAQILVILAADLPEEKREKVYADTERLVREAAGQDLDYYIAGNPALAVLISTNMRSDLATLIPLVALAVLASLFLAFRRPGGVLLPMITVLVSVVWTVGLMALLEVPLSMIATVIPVMMIAVGSAYGIHIVSRFYDEDGEIRDRLARTLSAVGRPVVLAGLTTIAGFGSLVTSRVVPIRDFGVFTSFGVLSALLVSLTLIPSLIILRGAGRPARGGAGRPPAAVPEKSFLYAVYRYLGRGRRLPLFAAAFLLAAGVGAGRLDIDNVLVDHFKAGTSIRRADAFLRENFSGTRSFSVIVSGREKGALTDPAVLDAMDRLSRRLAAGHPEIPKVVSLSDFVRRMNRVLHGDEDGGGAYDEIPVDPEKYGFKDPAELKNLVSQYLLLYSGSLDRWADDAIEPSSARMLVPMTSVGNRKTAAVIRDIRSFAESDFPPGIDIGFAGIALIETALLDLIVESQWWSIAVSLLAVFVILALNFRSAKAGLVGVVPLSFSILFNFAVMGYAGIRLDISTAMVASVAVGVGIDYTIHFLSRYVSPDGGAGDPDGRVRGTLGSTGKAITFNAVSVGAGFAVLLLSQFKPLDYFGLLIVLTMATSSVGAMTILPAVLKKTGVRIAAPKS